MNDYRRQIYLQEEARKEGKRPLHMVNHVTMDYLDSVRPTWVRLVDTPESELSDKEFLYLHELNTLYDKIENGKIRVLSEESC